MGLQLPDWLTEPASWVGIDWPEADEEKLYEAGKAWLEFAFALDPITERANKIAAEVVAENDGPVVGAFEAWWTSDLGPRERLHDDYLAALAIGTALLLFAAATLAAKIAFIAELIHLAASVAAMVVAGIMTGGLAAVRMGAHIVQTRLTLKLIKDKLTDLVNRGVRELLERGSKLLRRSDHGLGSGVNSRSLPRQSQETPWWDRGDGTPYWAKPHTPTVPIPGRIVRNDPYPVVGHNMKGENDPTNPNAPFGGRVKYFKEHEREQHRLFVHDGKLYRVSDGQPFDTANGKAIYVMDEHGNLYATTQAQRGRIHHTSLVAGEPVAGAGEMRVFHGTVLHIDRSSGHYAPDHKHLANVQYELTRQGLKTDPSVWDYSTPE